MNASSGRGVVIHEYEHFAQKKVILPCVVSYVYNCGEGVAPFVGNFEKSAHRARD